MGADVGVAVFCGVITVITLQTDHQTREMIPLLLIAASFQPSLISSIGGWHAGVSTLLCPVILMLDPEGLVK